MRILLSLIVIFFLYSCSLNKDSINFRENIVNKKEEKEKLSKILKKSNDITLMTLEEYKIYIEDYTKKSNYPDISK